MVDTGAEKRVGSDRVSAADSWYGTTASTTANSDWSGYMKHHSVEDLAKHPDLKPLRKEFATVGNLLNGYLNQTYDYGNGEEEGY